jgi:hypothetical protein
MFQNSNTKFQAAQKFLPESQSFQKVLSLGQRKLVFQLKVLIKLVSNHQKMFFFFFVNINANEHRQQVKVHLLEQVLFKIKIKFLV